MPHRSGADVQRTVHPRPRGSSETGQPVDTERPGYSYAGSLGGLEWPHSAVKCLIEQGASQYNCDFVVLHADMNAFEAGRLSGL